MKVLFVIGTRPEIIKTAPVINLLRGRSEYEVKVCFTGQHRALVDQMLVDFDVPVHFDLGIMRPNQSLEDIASRTLSGLEPVLRRTRPDLVFVQGDTTSAMATALAAFYERIPVAHLEAGLRTFDKTRPYPEEINRVLISRVADLHFAPTARARANLLREGIRPKSVYVTGNTVVDAIQRIRGICPGPIDSRLKALPPAKRIITITVHRRESFGKPLRNICRALKTIAARHPDTLLVYPVHPNPNVRRPVRSLLGKTKNILLLEPIHYRDTAYLLSRSCLVLTDSGGIQEEAPSFNLPVIVLREKTERPEGVALGIARVAGTDSRKIVREVERLLKSPGAHARMRLGKRRNPYGDGKAAERIVRILDRFRGII